MTKYNCLVWREREGGRREGEKEGRREEGGEERREGEREGVRERGKERRGGGRRSDKGKRNIIYLVIIVFTHKR